MKSLVLLVLFFASSAFAREVATLQSPDGKNQIVVEHSQGRLSYRVSRSGLTVLQKSHLGMRIRAKGDLARDLEFLGARTAERRESWQQPWGQTRVVEDNYNAVTLSLRHRPSQVKFDVQFRAFNDGVAFRYHWPKQLTLKYFELDDESSEFRFDPKDRAWWIPAFRDNRYEFLFTRSPIADLHVVHTPLTVELTNGLTVSIHEARLIDYPSMALKQHGNGVLASDLVPWADGVDAKLRAPHFTPWRTIQIAEDPSKLIESTMILNLNDPSKIADTSWIKTGKYIGIWWAMHIKRWTWGSGPHHGATTQNTKDYIDFAAAHGLDGVLVEGWNESWDGDWMKNGDIFRFAQPYPDFDIVELSRYAEQKGVRIIGHHETSANTVNYLSQIEAAFDFTNTYGIETVKTGHVGTRLDHREWHHGQYGVNFYNGVTQYAARRKTMLVVHEPIKQTGLERTYPNLMSAEGARGQEYDAWTWDYSNPPQHTTVLPFTRMLAGPMDFTPGTFKLQNSGANPNRVMTTLAKQLALFVVIYSPWQMLSDLPENYLLYPEAFEFLKRVPTNWETSKGLAGKIGEYVVIARKDRQSDNWYLGAITDERPRTVTVKLDFLEPETWYEVRAYQDAANASWDRNPQAIQIYKTRVKGGGSFDLRMAAGGGVALEFVKAK